MIFEYPQIDVPRGVSLPAEFDMFMKVLPPFIEKGCLCLDIGANLGTSSIAMSILAGATVGGVMSFEINPEVYSFLIKNLELNQIKNCTAYNTGCSDRDEYKTFGGGRSNGGIMDGFSIEEERGHCQLVELPCINTAQFLLKHDLNNLKFIKMDIEGWEPVVLKNIKPILDMYKPLIYTEWWFHKSKNDNLFDAIDFIGYNPLNPDTMEKVCREDFDTKHVHDLLLQPIKK